MRSTTAAAWPTHRAKARAARRIRGRRVRDSWQSR